MSRLVIKQHKPLHMFMVIVAVCVVLTLALWVSLDKSHWAYIKSRFISGKENKTLWESNKLLEKENRELNEQLIKLERISQVDKQTAVNLQQDLRNLQDQIYRLKGELEFYQGIMDTAQEVQGLNIQGLHIVPLSQASSFRFKLILTQVSKSDKVTEGKVEMVLEGMLDGTPKVLNIEELITEKTVPFDYKFKHFQRLEGNILLPELFQPNTITVKLQPNGKNLSKLEKVFDWNAVTVN